MEYDQFAGALAVEGVCAVAELAEVCIFRFSGRFRPFCIFSAAAVGLSQCSLAGAGGQAGPDSDSVQYYVREALSGLARGEVSEVI